MQNQNLGGDGNRLVIQVIRCYILEHLKGRKAWIVHFYFTWRNIVSQLQSRTRLMLRASTQFENSNYATSLQQI